MFTWSRVTPLLVAPPFSPDQYGTHGGDCGSSICRGGSPTHLRTRGTSITCWSLAGSSGGMPPAPQACPAAHSPEPCPELLDCSAGASVIWSTACGANSAMLGGGG